VVVETTGFWKMLKLVSLRLKTQAGRNKSETEGNGMNQAHRHWVGVAKYTVLPGFTFIGKLLHDL
jgi:hypothetical protein